MENLKTLTRARIHEIYNTEKPDKTDSELVTKWYETESLNILASIGKEEAKRLFSYDECEVERDYLGFLENYKDLSEILPKDFTIIDIGSYMSFQADYYKGFKHYIGVEPWVPLEFRLRQPNAEYYEQTAQRFIAETLPQLITAGLDLNKTFAICSAVPDKTTKLLVAKTFKYFRVAYPGEDDLENFPEN